MNFLKMSPWANFPVIDNDNHIMVTTSQELFIPSHQIVEINLGLILLSLPQNHIVKITNPQNKYTILNDFWLLSPNELSLHIISKTPLHIKVGESLCHLRLLPIQVFLPGIPPCTLNPSKILTIFNNVIFTELQPEPQKKIKIRGR